MGLLAVAMVEVKLTFTKMRRYPLQTLSSVVVLYILFMGLLYGSRAMVTDSPVDPGDGPATKALMGFFMWYLALFAIDSMSQTVSDEAQSGTLEQLYMARWSFPVMLLLRFLASLTGSAAMAIPLFLLVRVTTGIRLEVSSGWAALIIAISMLGLCGFGYVLAALALLFKRIGGATSIIHFGLLFIALSPLERLSAPMQALAAILPLAQGVKLLRSVLDDGMMPAARLAQVGILAGNALLYLAGGVLFLKWAERRAREQGLLGHY
ncbi:MAG: ABC transporter permease [Polyangiaceae bacterium]|nr:ABC transporter permease [Polyangiaceae bacterium]